MKNPEEMHTRDCPMLEPCPHMTPDCKCSLAEPWLECDDYAYAYGDESEEI